jgi:hypothetical protein
LDELVAKNHPVRVVNEVLDKVDITGLMKQSPVAQAATTPVCY